RAHENRFVVYGVELEVAQPGQERVTTQLTRLDDNAGMGFLELDVQGAGECLGVLGRLQRAGDVPDREGVHGRGDGFVLDVSAQLVGEGPEFRGLPPGVVLTRTGD